MSLVREAAAAGRFYPADREELRAAIRSYLAGARLPERALTPTRSACVFTGDRVLPSERIRLPKGIIAPHAGYVYSGSVAATAYDAIEALRGRVTRVMLFGPAHFVRVAGLAVPSVSAFDTPLGRVPIDDAARTRALGLPQVVVDDRAHADEHSLEVHLPFLQEVLGDFSLLPFAIGQASADQVAQVMELLWGGDETLFVISSDLSHFHDHDTASRIDAETSQMIEQSRVDELTGERCCGFQAIGGMLLAAGARGLRVRNLDLRNSGDTAGPRERVVGYGAYVIE